METTPSTTLPDQEERIMAALSHGSALLPMIGIILPIIIWVTQKEKSKYVAFQALQAAGYQVLMILAGFVGMGCYMVSIFGVFGGGILATNSGRNLGIGELFMFFPFLVFGLIFCGGFLFIAYALFGAVMALQGKDFRYLLVGSQVEKFLQKE
jgi:uncharacterized Tic20 family protein